jgi:hypothetical protein
VERQRGIGQRVDLQIAVTIACCTHYWILEPTRQADIEVVKLKRQYEPG